MAENQVNTQSVPTADPWRGTGRTQRMIQEVVDAPEDLVVIVAPSALHFGDFLRRLRKLIPRGRFNATTPEVVRPDGRRIRIVSARNHKATAGLDARVFVDHAAAGG